MFTRLYAHNLKVWADQLWTEGMELAPVTLLLGPNSAGKTSLLQLPLLLKQTFASPDRRLDLNLGGQASDIIDLGRYEDVIHGHDPGLELGLGLDFDGRVGETATRWSYRATYAPASGVPALQSLAIEADGARCGARRQAKGAYLLEAPGYQHQPSGGKSEAKRTFQPERSLRFSAEALAEIGASAGHIQDLTLRLGRAVESIAYLGPLRERPERSYLWNRQNPGDLGSRGERAVHALLASANARGRGRGDEEGSPGWLVERVSGWLQRLGIADRMVLEQQGRSRFFEVVIEHEGRRANITDVGFGVSQVLPMLVLAHFVPRGATIIAEQPELHLHPRAQVGLAELMVEVARERQVQFLVETHAEHMFRRLQVLIAEDKLQPHECRLYFVDRGADRRAALQRLQVDAYGRVANWPPQFFGDALGESERLMERMMARMMADAGSGRGA